MWIKLTKRERELLICLSEGLTTFETAQKLFLSYETVKKQRSKIMQKLDARNAFQLGLLAMKYGLLDQNLKMSA